MLHRRHVLDMCIVLLQDPQFVFLQLWLVFTNSLSLCYQNFQIVNLIYSLTLWNPFSHQDAIDVEKTISVTLNFDFDVLAFFILCNAGVFQFMYCYSVSTSYWNIQVLLQVMIFSHQFWLFI